MKNNRFQKFLKSTFKPDAIIIYQYAIWVIIALAIVCGIISFLFYR